MGVKVTKMINTSRHTLPIILKGGEAVQVPPRGQLENVEVENLEKNEKYFRVQRDLSEVGRTPPPAPLQNLTEVGRKPPPGAKPARKRRRLDG